MKAYAINDFELSIREKERQFFEEAIKSLNEGWRSGLPSDVLNGYMEVIENSSRRMGRRESLPGLCAVANVKYLSGDLIGAKRRARNNRRKLRILSIWRKVKNLSKDEDDILLEWMASYARLNTECFVKGKFGRAMRRMRNQYKEETERDLVSGRLSDRSAFDPLLLGTPEDVLTLDPVLSIPRNLILAAALHASRPREIDGPREFIRWCYGKATAWLPGKARQQPGENGGRLESEMRFIKERYDEVLESERANGDPVAHELSHAYAVLAFILLHLRSGDSQKEGGGSAKAGRQRMRAWIRLLMESTGILEEEPPSHAYPPR